MTRLRPCPRPAALRVLVPQGDQEMLYFGGFYHFRLALQLRIEQAIPQHKRSIFVPYVDFSGLLTRSISMPVFGQIDPEKIF